MNYTQWKGRVKRRLAKNLQRRRKDAASQVRTAWLPALYARCYSPVTPIELQLQSASCVQLSERQKQ
jgi:hypothetical protein